MQCRQEDLCNSPLPWVALKRRGGTWENFYIPVLGLCYSHISCFHLVAILARILYLKNQKKFLGIDLVSTPLKKGKCLSV